MEEEYLEYVMQFSLSLFAVSAAYFFDPSNPVTGLSLLLVPVLFGYTAVISSESFRRSSLLSMLILVFVFVNFKLAIIATITAFGNVLTSFFANGESFKDFYGATTVPLLLTGLLLGAAVYGAADIHPGVEEIVVDDSTDKLGNYTAEMVRSTGVIESQKDAQKQMLEQTSTASIMLANKVVLNETNDELSPSELNTVNNAFRTAEDEVPERIKSRAGQASGAIDIAGRISDGLQSLLNANLYLIIIFIGLIVYSLHPVVGILTAVFASAIKKINRTRSGSEAGEKPDSSPT